MKNKTAKLIADFTEFVRNNYSPNEKVKQSKDGTRTIFFRKSGKSLCYIEIKNERTIVTVVIGVSLNDSVESANVSQKTKQMFTKAKQFHDGKWLFFEIKTKKDIEDVKTLLSIKTAPIRK